MPTDQTPTLTIEQRRLEMIAAFQKPENIALLNQLVDGFNYLYNEDGLNVIVQVHSEEDETGRRWRAYVEDAHTIPDVRFVVEIKPDKSISPVVVVEPPLIN